MTARQRRAFVASGSVLVALIAAAIWLGGRRAGETISATIGKVEIGRSECYRSVTVDGRYSIVGVFQVPRHRHNREDCYQFSYLADGRLARVEYRKAGRLAVDADSGVAIWIIEYSEGFEKRMYFNVRAKPTSSDKGPYSIRLKLDERGNRVSLFNYGPDGELAPDENGVAQYLWAVDHKGRRVRSMRLDREGQRIADERGIFEARWQYPDGEEVQSSHGKDGQLRESKSGVALIRQRIDRNGQVTEMRFYGSDEQPREARDSGIAQVRQAYGDDGRLIKSAFFGLDDQLREHREIGAAAITLKYDESGRVGEKASWGTDGQLKRDKNGGVAIYRYRYDDRGNEVEVRFFGPDEAPTLEKESGAAAIRRQFNEYREIVEEAFFDRADNPAQGSKYGAPLVRWRYDDSGRAIERKLVAGDGRTLTEDARGVAITRWEYDERGTVVKTLTYDAGERRRGP